MLIYRADGKVDRVDLGGKKVTLDQLQGAVGGYVESVPGTARRAYCDEEGLRKAKPFNAQASLLFGMKLVGDVAHLEPGDRQ